MKPARTAASLAVLAALALACVSQEEVLAQGSATERFDPKRGYSPYPEQTFPNRVYFGDTHLHTSYSTDAGMAGQKLGPEDAYRFARGEEVTSTTGLRARLRRPLDFLVVADHSENLGLAPLIARSDPSVLANPLAKKWHDMAKSGPEGGYKAFLEWIAMMGTGKDGIDSPAMKKPAWEHIVGMGEKYNEPGRFTAFLGFEWTSGPNGGNNLHRVVVFRDDAKRALQVIPFSLYDSQDPEDLWKWMDAYEKKTGGKALAIPHNGNLSNGLMFAAETLTSKKPLDRDYAERRMRWEPLVEVTQAKGTAEAHPFLSRNDEFANFDLLDKSNLNGTAPKTRDMLQYEYAREALKRGLAYEQQFGANPFKFGMIGSTDNHTALATTDEDNWFGKAHILEPSPERFKDVLIKSPVDPKLSITALDLSASGLVGVWARENTREALWDAMARKEVFGTSGSRLLVRVFGGYDFTARDLNRADFAEQGYKRGVPMGGDLKAAPSGKAPSFLIRALRDADGANLDRIQVVKGWVDAAGKTHEQVYDVTWSGSRKKDPKTGKLPAVGNTVDVADASYSNSIGAPLLQAYWRDPKFNPKERAFYYVRVLEIPTPRWLAYDAKFFKLKLPEGTRMFSQERAYTSPIWYTPS
jgi:hypothetical protein